MYGRISLDSRDASRGSSGWGFVDMWGAQRHDEYLGWTEVKGTSRFLSSHQSHRYGSDTPNVFEPGEINSSFMVYVMWPGYERDHTYLR